MSTDEPEPAPPDSPPAGPVKSYGNMSEHHWSRTRGARNAEAIDYYRERSKAPGVAEGGEARNFYCMDCDGVIPYEHEGPACPHCGADLAGLARRYFNWVEIDQPTDSDFKALLPYLVGGVVLLALVGWGLAQLF